MPRGPAFTPEIKALAVAEYTAGRATMPALAAELGTTTATISRWVKAANTEARIAAAHGVPPAAPTDAAARVAALAPPPAPAEEPLPELGDGTAALIGALKRDYREHLETARRLAKIGDHKGSTAARTAAGKALTEIRHLEAAERKAGGEALAITRDDIAAAELEIRRRLDEYQAGRGGEPLMWTLDGTPALRNADSSHVTRDTPDPGPRRA